MSPEELADHVEKVAAALGEHFDAVQILASHSDGRGTMCIKRGSGNWYARQGMAQEFIQSQESKINADFLASKLDRDGE